MKKQIFDWFPGGGSPLRPRLRRPQGRRHRSRFLRRRQPGRQGRQVQPQGRAQKGPRRGLFLPVRLSPAAATCKPAPSPRNRTSSPPPAPPSSACRATPWTVCKNTPPIPNSAPANSRWRPIDTKIGKTYDLPVSPPAQGQGQSGRTPDPRHHRAAHLCDRQGRQDQSRHVFQGRWPVARSTMSTSRWSWVSAK